MICIRPCHDVNAVDAVVTEQDMLPLWRFPESWESQHTGQVLDI